MTKRKSKGLLLFKINAITREIVKLETLEDFKFEKEYVYFTAINERNALRKFDNAIKKITK